METKVNDEELKRVLSFMGENYYFFLERYKDIFFMTPLEFAKVINGMGENEFFEFKDNFECIEGHTTDLINEKIAELKKYALFNATLGEALIKIIGVKNADEFKMANEMFADKTGHSAAITAYEVLFFIYPAFRKHFFKLKTAGIITETETGLKWHRTEIAIAEYFKCLECNERRQRWRVVEKVFGFNNLRQYLYNHKERQMGKPSKDFEEIKELLDLK